MVNGMPEVYGTGAEGASRAENIVRIADAGKRKIVRGALYYGRVIISSVIIITMIVLMTTELSFDIDFDLSDIALSFVCVLVCSYTLYISGAESGTERGRATEAYAEICRRYDEIKQKVTEGDFYEDLEKFCRGYAEREQERARNTILSSAGISITEFNFKYMRLSRREIGKLNITKTRKRAILSAMRVKEIRLTPEMLLRRGRYAEGRAPLGTAPEVKRRRGIAASLVRILFVSFFTSVIVINAVAEPSWQSFALVMAKLCPLVVSLFQGYSFGYRNITVDTVSFVGDQTEILGAFVAGRKPVTLASENDTE